MNQKSLGSYRFGVAILNCRLGQNVRQMRKVCPALAVISSDTFTKWEVHNGATMTS